MISYVCNRNWFFKIHFIGTLGKSNLRTMQNFPLSTSKELTKLKTDFNDNICHDLSYKFLYQRNLCVKMYVKNWVISITLLKSYDMALIMACNFRGFMNMLTSYGIFQLKTIPDVKTQKDMQSYYSCIIMLFKVSFVSSTPY